MYRALVKLTVLAIVVLGVAWAVLPSHNVATTPAVVPNQAAPAAVEQATCHGQFPTRDGMIEFGTGLDASTLTLTCPADSFPVGSPFAWRAQFDPTVSAGTFPVVIAREVGNTTEQAVLNQTIETTAETSAYGLQEVSGFLAHLGPGIYAIRVYAGTDIVSVGQFEVTP